MNVEGTVLGGMHGARRARIRKEDERRAKSPMSEEYQMLLNVLKERNDVCYPSKMASKVRGLMKNSLDKFRVVDRKSELADCFDKLYTVLTLNKHFIPC